MTRKRLKAKFDLGLNEVGVGGVAGLGAGIAFFEGVAHLGGAGMVLAGAVAVVGGLIGKPTADGAKYIASKALVNPPEVFMQNDTFGRGPVEQTRCGSDLDTVVAEKTIVLGTDKRTRQNVEYTMYQLKGILVLGLPGMGKTVTVSTIATQLVANGAALSIIDIKGQLDDSLTGLLAPFEAAFATPPAYDPQPMFDAAEYADSILEDRLKKRTTDLYPYYLIIDEFTDLMLSIKTKDPYSDAANKIAYVVKRINILGRSLNVFCFAMGQITTAETTGGTAVRETFNTRILHGMSEYEAGIVEKNGGKKTISQLEVGEAWIAVGGTREESRVVKIKQISDQEKRTIASGVRRSGEPDKATRLLPNVDLNGDEEDLSKQTRRLPEVETVEIGKDNGPGKTPIYTTKANIDFLVAAARAGKPISQSTIQATLGCTEAISKNVSRMVGEIAASSEELS